MHLGSFLVAWLNHLGEATPPCIGGGGIFLKAPGVSPVLWQETGAWKKGFKLKELLPLSSSYSPTSRYWKGLTTLAGGSSGEEKVASTPGSQLGAVRSQTRSPIVAARDKLNLMVPCAFLIVSASLKGKPELPSTAPVPSRSRVTFGLWEGVAGRECGLCLRGQDPGVSCG